MESTKIFAWVILIGLLLCVAAEGADNVKLSHELRDLKEQLAKDLPVNIYDQDDNLRVTVNARFIEDVHLKTMVWKTRAERDNDRFVEWKLQESDYSGTSVHIGGY